MLLILGKIGKTIDTVSASEYKKQITETARELYETAIKSIARLHMVVTTEINKRINLSNITTGKNHIVGETDSY